MIDKVRSILEEFCDQNGGGHREIRVEPGRFGGYSIVLVWDGFANKEISSQIIQVVEAIKSKLSADENRQIRKIRLYTFNMLDQLAEEEAIAGAIPSVPSFLR